MEPIFSSSDSDSDADDNNAIVSHNSNSFPTAFMARGANGTPSQKDSSNQQSLNGTRQNLNQILQRSLIFINPRFLDSSSQAFTADGADVDFVMDSGCSTHMVPASMTLFNETPITTTVRFGVSSCRVSIIIGDV